MDTHLNNQQTMPKRPFEDELEAIEGPGDVRRLFHETMYFDATAASVYRSLERSNDFSTEDMLRYMVVAMSVRAGELEAMVEKYAEIHPATLSLESNSVTD